MKAPHLHPDRFRISWDGPGLFYLNYEAANPRYGRATQRGGDPRLFWSELKPDFFPSKERTDAKAKPAKPWPALPPGKIVVWADTENQRRCALPLLPHLPDAIHCSFREGADLRLTYEQPNEAGRRFRWTLARAWLFSGGYWKRSLASMPQSYRWACGHFFTFREWFRESRPALVLVANDHSTAHRACSLAAKSLGIPTAFLQHASTGEEPAPLHYDLAFLDSETDLERYREREPWMTDHCRAFVQGNPQHDPSVEVRRSFPKDSTVGLCVSSEPELRAAIDLSRLAAEAGWKAMVRPHPSFALQAATFVAGMEDIRLSDSKSESTLSFLEQVTCVVSGLSSIIRDAVIAGRTALLYEPFRRAAGDWYGFEKAGLCALLADADAFRGYLAAPSSFAPSAETVRRFHASFGTPWEGQSALVVAGVIRRFLSGGDPAGGDAFMPGPTWGEKGKLEIYRLAEAGRA